MSSDLRSVLTAESRAIVDIFMRWLQLSMDQCRRELHVEAASYQNSNVIYSQYSRDQTQDMLRGELTVLQGVADAHMTSWSTAVTALMTAVMHEADRQRLTLDIDVLTLLRESSCPDKHYSSTRGGTADGIAEGVAHGGGSSSHGPAAAVGSGIGDAAGGVMDLIIKGPRTRLAPLTIAEAGGEAARQLAEANQEIKRLRAKLQRAARDPAEKQKSRRRSSSATTCGQTDNDAGTMHNPDVHGAGSTHDSKPHRPTGDEEGHVVEDELTALRGELAAMKEQLAGRLSQSPQVNELRSLLIRRNKQMRELQERLVEIDPTFRWEHQKDNIEPEVS